MVQTPKEKQGKAGVYGGKEILDSNQAQGIYSHDEEKGTMRKRFRESYLKKTQYL